ncbi:MAG: DUF3461 family protein [Arenicella sp.]
MTDYPTLSNMGITRFNEIRDYSLFTEKESDVLKIYYKRKEGSLLPRRKVFKFPKSTKPFTENDIDKSIRELRQISPTIRSAIAELDTILSEKKGKIDHKEAINRRLEQLEAEVQSNIAEIRSLLERI